MEYIFFKDISILQIQSELSILDFKRYLKGNEWNG